MGSMLRALNSGAWVARSGQKLNLTLFQRRNRDDLVSDLANDLVFGAGRYSRAITINPPSGFLALAVAEGFATTTADSIFAYLPGVGPRQRDQAVVPTTYSGGDITWADFFGIPTGRIASVTGAGNGILTIDYWRESTRTTTTYQVIMQAGVIVAAFSVASNSLSQQQTIASGTLSIPGSTLTAHSITQEQSLGSPSLTQTHNLAANGLYNAQAIENGAFQTGATYARSIALNPPAGHTARPVLASIAVQTPYSFFSYLGFSPADGDQAVTPDTWNDSGMPRAIVWAVDGSGHPTGVVTSVANGPATIDVDYWRQSTGTWSTVTMTVVTPVTLTAQGVVTAHALAASAVIPPGGLGVNGLTTVQSIENGYVATSGSSAARYSRAITFNPPAGRAAYPISATTAVQGSQSVFSLLVGTPVTGDQAVPPLTYVDGSSITRNITWELDGSGNMTGRIAEIEGNGVTALTIPYWDSTTGTWFTISTNLQDYQAGIVAQNVVSVQTVGVGSVGVQSGLLPQSIVNQQVLYPANIALQYSVLPNQIITSQSLSVGGISTEGGLSAFPIVTDQALASASLNQTHEMQPASLITVQALGHGPLNSLFDIFPESVISVQALAAAAATPADFLYPDVIYTAQSLGSPALNLGPVLRSHRIDTRQTLQQSVLNMPPNGSISCKLSLYPAIWGKISMSAS